MRTFEQRVSDLLLDVYESASNPQHWSTFLENLAREMGATKSALHVHYFAPGNTTQSAQGSCAVAIGYDTVSLADYATYYASQDLYVQRIRERFPSGMHVGTSEDLVTPDELRKTELYQDFCHPNGVFHICWSAVEQNKGIAAGLGFIRPENAKPFEGKDVNLLKLLNPHLSKAFHLQRIISNATNQNTALLSSVAQLDFGVIAISYDGRVTNLSTPAKRILDERDGIYIRSGILEATGSAENNKLQQMLRIARNYLVDSLQSDVNTMFISRGTGKRPLQVSVFSFISSMLLAEDRPQIIVLLSDPSAKPVSRAAVLRSLYGLTPTESRLADLLLQGLEVREAADQLGTTLETTRFHVKRVLAKTGTRRQTELIRLMLSLPGQ